MTTEEPEEIYLIISYRTISSYKKKRLMDMARAFKEAESKQSPAPNEVAPI